MPLSLRQQFPLRVILGGEDVTQYLDEGMSWSSVDPGGFEACSLPFPRDLPAALRGQYLRIDAGLRVAWEGRVSQVQRSLGHRTTIMGEGYGALFKDQQASMVFVDRDLTRWQTPSYSRQAAYARQPANLTSAQVAADPTSLKPALVQTLAAGSTQVPICETWYDAGPLNTIDYVYYDLTFDAGVGGGTYTEQVSLSVDANATTLASSPNLNQNGENTGYFNPGGAWRFALLAHYYNGAIPGPGSTGQSFNFNAYWHNPAVYGRHGLPGRGSDPVGFYPSDIAGWAISQAGGLQRGVIQTTDASGYVVPHNAYYTPVYLDQILNDMAIAQGWHWGVWDSPSPLTGSALPRCDFRPRPAAGTVTASFYRRDCDMLDIREDLSQQYNAAIVAFTDVAGRPGAVTVTVDNPVLDRAGIARRTAVFNAGVMDAATAQVFGLQSLAILIAQQRVAGSANVISAIDGGVNAAFLLKPGIDRVRVVDAPSGDAFGGMLDYPISRMEANVSSSGIATSLELGSGGNLIEVLQSRLAAAAFLAGNGGG